MHVTLEFARLVVVILGIVCLLCISGIILLSAIGREIPHQLGTFGGMSMGVLVGIPITTRDASRGTDPVTIQKP